MSTGRNYTVGQWLKVVMGTDPEKSKKAKKQMSMEEMCKKMGI